MYMIIATTLSSQLKYVLPDIINELQSGFVPNRLITDNVLIELETFHWLQKGRSRGEKFMAMKWI